MKANNIARANLNRAFDRRAAGVTSNSEYGHRIATISVSPDGRWVVAGKRPDGRVVLFSTQTGTRERVYAHGGSTILITSFSPESKYLATFAAGKINVWKLP